MKQITQLLTLVTLTVVLFSCKKTNTQGRYIPASAAAAFHINGKSLSEKLPWAEIKSNSLFTEINGDSTVSAAVKKVLDNPENTGIDTKNDLLFFIQKDNDGGYLAFEGTIKDEKVFRDFCTETTGSSNISEQDGISYISRSPMSIGWKKDHFVYVVDMPTLRGYDELTERMKRDSIDVPAPKSRDIGATLRSVFAIEEKKSLAVNEKFTALVKEEGDLHIWLNSEEMNKGMNLPGMFSMLNLTKFYKDSYGAYTVNFGNGKISINSMSYSGEELTKLFKKYSEGKVNEDMLKRIPGKEPLALLGVHFKPEGMRELFKVFNFDAIVNMASPTLGFTLDDFIKANKGDVVLGVSDFGFVQDSIVYSEPDVDPVSSMFRRPKATVTFAVSVNDKDAFTKLMKAGDKAANTFFKNAPGMLSYGNSGDYFVLSTSRQSVDQFTTGGNAANADIISKISGEPIGAYINLQLLIKSLGNEATKDSSARQLYDASVKLWDYVTIKGGNFTNGGMAQSIEINLGDKTTNSLKQLNQYFALLAKLSAERKKKEREDMMAMEDALSTGDSSTAQQALINAAPKH